MKVKIDRKYVAARRLVFLALLAFVFAGVILTPAYAQRGGEELLYREDFDDRLAQGWSLGEWAVSDGRMFAKGAAKALYQKGIFGDSTLRFRFSPEELVGSFSVDRHVGEISNYAVEITAFSADNILRLSLRKHFGTLDGVPIFEEIASVDMGYDPKQDYWLEFRIESGSIFVEAYPVEFPPDLEPQIKFFDPEPVLSGRIGFTTNSDSFAWVDDVEVYSLEPALAETTVAPVRTEPPIADTVTPFEPAPDDTPLPSTEIQPTPPPAKTPQPDDTNTVLIVGGIVGGLLGLGVLGGLAGWMLRSWRRPRQPTQEPRGPEEQPDEPPEETPQPPPLPLFPPVRLIRLWLSEGGERGGRRLGGDESLVVGSSYSLHVQVQPGAIQFAGAMGVGQSGEHGGEGGAEASEIGPLERLNLVFFSPDEDFELERNPALLNLPENGASSSIRRVIRPRRSGLRRLRACVYYGNVLVQSALLETSVINPGQNAVRFGIQPTLDYVAHASLSDLGTLPQPAINIFTNQGADGTHWIGVFGSGDLSNYSLRSGMMGTFSDAELKERANALRELLARLQGGRNYRYIGGPPLDAVRLTQMEGDFVALALAGWKVFHSLFLARSGQVEYDRLPDVKKPALVSIARCRGDGPSLPWASLYDLRLDTARPEQVRLCGVFKSQLNANQWQGEILVQKYDLLDAPQACRALPSCPLNGPERRRTVCPFGFWGFVHQIEQPLQSVTPTPVDQIPPELVDERTANRYNQQTFLIPEVDDKVRIAIGAYPGIPNVEQHINEIEHAASADALELDISDDRDQVLLMLEEGGRQIYYFYCHGVVRAGEFRLLLGPAGNEGYLGAADLDPRETRWSGDLQPLVVLNGCETMRLTPELIHGFLGVLKQMGAAGVVGTEIPVNILLARPVGAWLVKRLLSGASIGEAFLEIRRTLQRQGNPLGLAYSFYSPAGLHIHDAQNCWWCSKSLLRYKK